MCHRVISCATCATRNKKNRIALPGQLSLMFQVLSSLLSCCYLLVPMYPIQCGKPNAINHPQVSIFMAAINHPQVMVGLWQAFPPKINPPLLWICPHCYDLRIGLGSQALGAAVIDVPNSHWLADEKRLKKPL